jgi:hypothetical protein
MGVTIFYCYVPDSFNGFYPILFQYSNTILKFLGFRILSKYSRNMKFVEKR